MNGRHLFNGVVTGVVTSLKDPKKQGRVKVKFAWMGDLVVSHWARVMAPLAGKGRGAFFMPKENDEVLVAFENGVFSRPYVLGGLWNARDTAPVSIADDNKYYVQMIRSATGHTLSMDDTEKKEKVTIASKGGHSIALDDTDQKGNVVVGSKGGHSITLNDEPGKEQLVIKSKSGHTITLSDASGGETLTIETKGGQHKIILKHDGAITIDSDKDIEIKAKGSVILSEGSQGAARLNDEVQSTAADDSAFWQWVMMMTTHTHGTSMGPTTPPTAPTSGPTSLKAKITKASEKVKVG